MQKVLFHELNFMFLEFRVSKMDNFGLLFPFLKIWLYKHEMCLYFLGTHSQVNIKQIYNYFIHALNYSIQDKIDSVFSENANINKNNHPVSIFCRTKVIIGQINHLEWNMVLLILLI